MKFNTTENFLLCSMHLITCEYTVHLKRQTFDHLLNVLCPGGGVVVKEIHDRLPIGVLKGEVNAWRGVVNRARGVVSHVIKGDVVN